MDDANSQSKFVLSIAEQDDHLSELVMSEFVNITQEWFEKAGKNSRASPVEK